MFKKAKNKITANPANQNGLFLFEGLYVVLVTSRAMVLKTSPKSKNVYVESFFSRMTEVSVTNYNCISNVIL